MLKKFFQKIDMFSLSVYLREDNILTSTLRYLFNLEQVFLMISSPKTFFLNLKETFKNDFSILRNHLILIQDAKKSIFERWVHLSFFNYLFWNVYINFMNPLFRIHPWFILSGIGFSALFMEIFFFQILYFWLFSCHIDLCYVLSKDNTVFDIG